MDKSCATCRWNAVRALDNGWTHCDLLVAFVHTDPSVPWDDSVETQMITCDPTVQIPPPLGGPNFVCALWEGEE